MTQVNCNPSSVGKVTMLWKGRLDPCADSHCRTEMQSLGFRDGLLSWSLDDLTISIQNNRFLLSLIMQAMLIPMGTFISSRCNMASAGLDAVLNR